MNLDYLRGLGKRALNRSPRLYALARSAFITTKIALDRRAFARRYSDAAYIQYSDAELAAKAAKGSNSQYGQDLYLADLFGGKRDGFFVDIGANDPVKLSNSLYFERLGWAGMAFDPMSRFEDDWKRERKATFHRAGIAAVEETRDFVEILPREGWEHALSGFREFVRAEDMAMYGYKEYRVPTAPLSHFVRDGQTIDLIMVDVEGAEEIVFGAIDLKAMRPRYVMVENVGTLGGNEGVRRLILAQGYRLIARIGSADDVFARVDPA